MIIHLYIFNFYYNLKYYIHVGIKEKQTNAEEIVEDATVDVSGVNVVKQQEKG